MLAIHDCSRLTTWLANRSSPSTSSNVCLFSWPQSATGFPEFDDNWRANVSSPNARSKDIISGIFKKSLNRHGGNTNKAHPSHPHPVSLNEASYRLKVWNRDRIKSGQRRTSRYFSLDKIGRFMSSLKPEGSKRRLISWSSSDVHPTRQSDKR